MQYFSNTHIDFTGQNRRKLFATISIIFTIYGLFALFVLQPVLGIDFKGGSEIAVAFKNDVTISQLRSALEHSPIKDAEVKSFGTSGQYLIRIAETEKSESLVSNAIKSNLPNAPYTILKSDKIGPKIGSEIFLNAIWAVLISMVLMLVYIAFRFEFSYGLGAIIALAHDVMFTLGVVITVHRLGLINLEFNQQMLAAMLTVVGYSVNDTVIIFDRIRENRELHKGMNFIKLINLSINETLSRTVNTVMTVVLVLLVLVFFGGPVLQGFAFTMLLGIVIGTYSSVYIASSFVIWYLKKTGKETIIEPTHLELHPAEAK